MHPFPESQSSFLLLLLRHPRPSGFPGKELRAWGPTTGKELLREVTVHWAEGILQTRILLNPWKLGSPPAFHLLFFPPGASCPRGGWREVMGDFLTSTNKPFRCRW